MLAVACVGTAVAIYPVGRKFSPTLAIGFLASRALEAAVIFFGVVALMSVTTLRGLHAESAGDAGTAGAESLAIALHDWAFLLGPGVFPVVNALLFGTLLFRARLVPRAIPLVGLVGAPLLLASSLGSLFGVVDEVSAWAAVAAAPIALWEFGIGIWLLTRGFNTAAVEDRALALRS